MPQSSELKSKTSKKSAEVSAKLSTAISAGFLLGLLFNPDNGGNIVLLKNQALFELHGITTQKDHTVHSHHLEYIRFYILSGHKVNK
jgi:hypothetical protein